MNSYDYGQVFVMIRARLAEIRKERGYSAKRLSLEFGMKPYAISNIESGLALVPCRVRQYCEWAGFPADYHDLERWLEGEAGKAT